MTSSFVPKNHVLNKISQRTQCQYVPTESTHDSDLYVGVNFSCLYWHINIRVLPNAESTSRVQSFPQSLVPVLSAMRAGVIPRYPVAHAHSRYPNCPGGKDIIFIPGHFSFFLVTSSSYV